MLKELREGIPAALDRVRRRHPGFKNATASDLAPGQFRLSDAQLVVAREYGFSHWAELKERIDTNPLAVLLDTAIRAGDREAVARVLQSNPQLLHIAVRSGNWGSPMSHAANIGQLEIVKVAAQLGARDFQHAFNRAVLKGHLQCARWLLEHGAKLAPGIVMGPCETLNSAGLRFLDEAGAPLSDAKGNPLAPLEQVL